MSCKNKRNSRYQVLFFFFRKRWGNAESFTESFTSMDLCSSLLASCLSSSLIKPQFLTSSLITNSIIPNCTSKKCKSRHVLKASAGPFSYQKFIHFALDETKRRTLLVPSPLQVLFYFSLPFFLVLFVGSRNGLVLFESSSSLQFVLRFFIEFCLRVGNEVGLWCLNYIGVYAGFFGL